MLEQGIANGGTTLRDYRTPDGEPGRNQLELGAYGRAGEPCLRCGTELRRTVIDARGTTYCPTCQTPTVSSHGEVAHRRCCPCGWWGC